MNRLLSSLTRLTKSQFIDYFNVKKIPSIPLTLKSNIFLNFCRNRMSLRRKLLQPTDYFIKKIKKKPDKIIKTPFRKGVVVKLIKLRPKKPNSGNRRCVVVRLNDSRLVTAYIPGENGQVQEHGIVLIYKKPKKDVPGLKYRVVRNKLDMK